MFGRNGLERPVPPGSAPRQPATSMPSSRRCASRGSRNCSSHHCSARPSRSPCHRHTAGSARADRPSAFPRVRRAQQRRHAPARHPADAEARRAARGSSRASAAPPRPARRAGHTRAGRAPRRIGDDDGPVRADRVRVSAPLTAASGWRGDTANTLHRAQLEPRNRESPAARWSHRSARSARPSRSAPQVPPSTSCVKRSDTPESSASNARTTGSSVSNSSTSSLTIHNRSSQPLATCRTRCVSRATSSPAAPLRRSATGRPA